MILIMEMKFELEKYIHIFMGVGVESYSTWYQIELMYTDAWEKEQIDVFAFQK